MKKSLIALLLAAVMALCACQSRTDTPQDFDSEAQQSSSQEEAPEEEQPPEESEESEPQMTEEEAKELVEDLLQSGNLLALVANYNGSFDKPEEISQVQMLWSLYKWAELSGQIQQPEEPDYEGYAQADKATVDALLLRWYGVKSLDYSGNAQTLGDIASGDPVNFDPEKNTYDFMDADLPLNERAELGAVSLGEDGTITAEFDTTQIEGGEYVQTYRLKLAPYEEDGHYYLTSLNKGKTD